MTSNPYQDDRGNKDASITKRTGGGTLTPSPGTGQAMKTTEAFLIGDTMTGGYGKGPDILHDCTIAVNAGEIAVIVGPNGAGKSTAMKAVFGLEPDHEHFLYSRKVAFKWDGETLAEHKLDALPVFDGLAAARGRLFLTTKDGKLHSFTP